MKIISKYSDFYDSALAHGVDKSIIYKRKEEEIFFEYEGRYRPVKQSQADLNYISFSSEMKDILNKLKPRSIGNIFLSEKDSHNREKGDKSIFFGYLFFCGEVIPYIYYTEYSGISAVKNVFYSFEAFIKGLEKETEQKYIDNFLNDTIGYFDKKVIKQSVVELFSIEQNCENLHHEMDCPVFLIEKEPRFVSGNGSYSLIKNPILKDINFARKYNPYEVFQKLEQFISGVLGGQSPKMVEIEDIYRIQAHGFDKKISFRKRKGD